MEEADTDIWWPRWMWVGEWFFWYRLTRVAPDIIQRAIKRLCVCVCFILALSLGFILSFLPYLSCYCYLFHDFKTTTTSWHWIAYHADVPLGNSSLPAVAWMHAVGLALTLMSCLKRVTASTNSSYSVCACVCVHCTFVLLSCCMLLKQQLCWLEHVICVKENCLARKLLFGELVSRNCSSSGLKIDCVLPTFWHGGSFAEMPGISWKQLTLHHCLSICLS